MRLALVIALALAADWSPRCLRQRGGCPIPEKPPACAGTPDAPLLDEDDVAAHEGKRVAVRGRIAPGGGGVTTLMACALTECCNTVRTGMLADRWLPLHDGKRPERFVCEGDASLMCCGVETVREGIALGKVVPVPAPGGTVVYRLEVESLCRLR